MKILCAIDSLCAGGAQRQLVELAVGFRERGHEVTVLVYHDIPFYKHILDQADVKTICIEEPNYLLRVIKLRRFIRNGKFQAVLSFLEAVNFICQVSGLPYRKWKLVVGERNADPFILKSFKLILFRWFHIFSNYVVANSNANINIVHKANPLLRNSKCKVIYNIIDYNRFKPAEDYRPRKNSKTNLVIVARQEYQKNLDGLVDALILLSESERNKIEIKWYGEEKGSHDINNVIRKAHDKIKQHSLNEVIQFQLPVKNIENIMQQTDAVGLFSHYEGFPNTIIEAMACAKTVICSDVSDIRIILSRNNKLLCKPGDPESIKRALLFLVNMSNEQLVESGNQNEKIVKSILNREDIISSYLQLFE